MNDKMKKQWIIKLKSGGNKPDQFREKELPASVTRCYVAVESLNWNG